MFDAGTMNTKNLTTRTMAIGAAALLLLTGCGDGGDESIEPVDTTQAPPADGDDGQDDGSTDPADDTQDTGAGDADDQTDEAGTAGGDHAGVLAAVDLAESETGGVAFELDDDDDGTWEIQVADGEDELEVLVSADGAEMLGIEPDGRLDDEDRQALDAATITLTEAIEIAAEHAAGQVDAVDLDEEDGVFTWEVDFTDDVEVYLNVENGEVLKVEND